MESIRSGYFKFELNNGDIVMITLNFGALYRLRNTDKQLYDEYNGILRKKDTDKDEIDSARLVYVAYRCANEADHMSFEEFIDKMPYNRKYIQRIIQDLYYTSKKKEISKTYFEQQPKG